MAWNVLATRESHVYRLQVWSLLLVGAGHCTLWMLILFCSALDVFHITLSMHVIYYYLILNYNNPPALQLSVW